MARIDPIPTREWPPEMMEALAAMNPPNPRHPELRAENRPKALNLLGTFAHHPALTRAFLTFNGHLLRATTLTERQRELIVLRVAAVQQARYEWGQHLVMAEDAGIDADEVARVESDPGSPEWSDLEAALLRAVDEVLGDGVIGESTWAALAAELDNQQILDVIFTIGAYTTLAWMMRSVGLEIDADLREAMAQAAEG